MKINLEFKFSEWLNNFDKGFGMLPDWQKNTFFGFLLIAGILLLLYFIWLFCYLVFISSGWALLSLFLIPAFILRNVFKNAKKIKEKNNSEAV